MAKLMVVGEVAQVQILTDAVRAVVEAARAWHAGLIQATADNPEAKYKVLDSVNALETILAQQPQVIEKERTWGEVLAGMQVRTPRGEWLEVKASYADGLTQQISLEVSGRALLLSRPMLEEIMTRMTVTPASIESAYAALAEQLGPLEVLKDGEGS